MTSHGRIHPVEISLQLHRKFQAGEFLLLFTQTVFFPGPDCLAFGFLCTECKPCVNRNHSHSAVLLLERALEGSHNGRTPSPKFFPTTSLNQQYGCGSKFKITRVAQVLVFGSICQAANLAHFFWSHSHMAMNFHEEPPRKWLVDMNPSTMFTKGSRMKIQALGLCQN